MFPLTRASHFGTGFLSHSHIGLMELAESGRLLYSGLGPRNGSVCVCVCYTSGEPRFFLGNPRETTHGSRLVFILVGRGGDKLALLPKLSRVKSVVLHPTEQLYCNEEAQGPL